MKDRYILTRVDGWPHVYFAGFSCGKAKTTADYGKAKVMGLMEAQDTAKMLEGGGIVWGIRRWGVVE